MKSISTKDMSREDWLVLRKKTIGGSDAAAIVGMSKYASPYSVWADKTGRTPDKPDTEAMRIGRDLEQYVADRWMESTGKKCHVLRSMLYNEKYPFAAANIDRKVTGENAGLECKTTSAWNAGAFHKGTEFPERYYCQCVHYMAVTGWDRWYLSVLVLGDGLYTYVLERDQAEIDALMEAEREFWECVKSDTPPAVDGSAATSETLSTIYVESDGSEISLFGREKLLQKYDDLIADKKSIDGEIEEVKNILKADMGENETALCGERKITWKNQERRTLDTKAFKKAYPQIPLDGFYKVSASRVFKIN